MVVSETRRAVAPLASRTVSRAGAPPGGLATTIPSGASGVSAGANAGLGRSVATYSQPT